MPSKSSPRTFLKTRLYDMVGFTAEIRRQSFEFIHVVACMRSGSTLLTHILTSNPEIFGVGETKIAIKSESDLRRVLGKVLIMQRHAGEVLTGQERLILDKIVYSHYLEPTDISAVAGPRSHVVFLTREPTGTLSSIIRKMKWSEARAVDHYVARMADLRLSAENLAPLRSSVHIDYSDLVERTQPTLALLQSALNLSEPLSGNYQTSSHTGNFALGDDSTNIHAGRILKKTSSNQMALGAESLARSHAAYQEALATFDQLCQTPRNAIAA